MTYLLDFRTQILKSLDEGMPLFKWLSSIISAQPPYKTGRDVFIAKQLDKPNPIKYQMTCYLMMSKNILMITSMSEHVVLTVVKQVFIMPSPYASVRKKTLEYPKACPIKRAAYQRNFDSLTQKCYPVVYMDESGFEHGAIRFHGYATDW